jgi:hypothetical protein
VYNSWSPEHAPVNVSTLNQNQSSGTMKTIPFYSILSSPATRHGDAWGEMSYSSYSFTASALDGVSCQCNASAALYPRGKDHRYPLDRWLGGPHNQSAHRGYRKNPFYSTLPCESTVTRVLSLVNVKAEVFSLWVFLISTDTVTVYGVVSHNASHTLWPLLISLVPPSEL